MELQEYEKDGRVISATETAYEVIYKTQGFRPTGEKPPDPNQSDDKSDGGKGSTKGGARGGKAGSDSGDRDEGAPAGKQEDA